MGRRRKNELVDVKKLEPSEFQAIAYGVYSRRAALRGVRITRKNWGRVKHGLIKEIALEKHFGLLRFNPFRSGLSLALEENFWWHYSEALVRNMTQGCILLEALKKTPFRPLETKSFKFGDRFDSISP